MIPNIIQDTHSVYTHHLYLKYSTMHDTYTRITLIIFSNCRSTYTIWRANPRQITANPAKKEKPRIEPQKSLQPSVPPYNTPRNKNKRTPSYIHLCKKRSASRAHNDAPRAETIKGTARAVNTATHRENIIFNRPVCTSVLSLSLSLSLSLLRVRVLPTRDGIQSHSI